MILLDKKFKMTISFSLNEHDFPPLSNVCQSILSNVNVSITRFCQRKPVSNVKHASVYVSPVCVTSVSELGKPINVSQPNVMSVTSVVL